MNEWDKIGAPFELFHRRVALRPNCRQCQYDRWGWNADHRRMTADQGHPHEMGTASELNDAVESEIERRRGGR